MNDNHFDFKDLMAFGIITAVNSDLAAADIIDLAVHLILRTLTDGHNGDHRCDTDDDP